jgi:hypothetical protein
MAVPSENNPPGVRDGPKYESYVVQVIELVVPLVVKLVGFVDG